MTSNDIVQYWHDGTYVTTFAVWNYDNAYCVMSFLDMYTQISALWVL